MPYGHTTNSLLDRGAACVRDVFSIITLSLRLPAFLSTGFEIHLLLCFRSMARFAGHDMGVKRAEPPMDPNFITTDWGCLSFFCDAVSGEPCKRERLGFTTTEVPSTLQYSYVRKFLKNCVF
jgi:hypothetical protein